MKWRVLTAMAAIVFLLPGLPASQEARFTVNGDATVTDNATGLMWQRCLAGLSGSDCSSGSAQLLNWEGALSYCEALSLAGHMDWRLPDVKELRSIVENRLCGPAIDTTAFPGTISGGYWSSSTFANYSPYAWYVHFSYGYVGYYSKTYTFYVRCVR